MKSPLLALLALTGSVASPVRPAFDVNDFGPLPPSSAPPPKRDRRTAAQKKKRDRRRIRKKHRGW